MTTTKLNPYGALFTLLAQQRDDLPEDRCVELYNLYIQPPTQVNYERDTIDFFHVKTEMFTPDLAADMLTVLIRLFRNRSIRNSSRRLIQKPFMLAWRDSARPGMQVIRQREVQQMVNFTQLVMYAYYWKLVDLFDPIRGWDVNNSMESTKAVGEQLMMMLTERMRDRYKEMMPFFIDTDVIAAQGHLQYLDVEFVFTQYGCRVTGTRQLLVRGTSTGLFKELDIHMPAPNAGFPVDLFDAHQ